MLVQCSLDGPTCLQFFTLLGLTIFVLRLTQNLWKKKTKKNYTEGQVQWLQARWQAQRVMGQESNKDFTTTIRGCLLLYENYFKFPWTGPHLITSFKLCIFDMTPSPIIKLTGDGSLKLPMGQPGLKGLRQSGIATACLLRAEANKRASPWSLGALLLALRLKLQLPSELYNGSLAYIFSS